MEEKDTLFICNCQEICHDLKSFDDHQRTNCRYRRIKCPLCYEGFPSSETMNSHSLDCGKKIDRCPVCQKFIQRAMFAYHFEKQCAGVSKSIVSSSQSNKKSNQTTSQTPIIQKNNIEIGHSNQSDTSGSSQQGPLQASSQSDDDKFCQKPDRTNPLKEDLDVLEARLLAIKNTIEHPVDYPEKLSSIKFNFIQRAEGWHQRAQHLVDEYCRKRMGEFAHLIDQETEKQKIEVARLQIRINELKEEQNITQESVDSMKNSIQSVDERINQVANVESTVSTLTIDDHLIDFSFNKSIFKYLFPLTPPYETIKLEEHNGCIAANEDHFVVIQNNILSVYDRRWQILRKLQWTHGDPYDVFWSNALDQFIFITEKKILIFNDKTMIISPFPLAENHDTVDFYGGACSGNSLFLFTWGWGPSIYEYALRPLVEFKKQYQSPEPYTTDELILHCAANNEALALVVKNQQNEIRFDLCLVTTMHRYYTVSLDLTAGNQQMRCCSLNNDHWMVICPDNSTLYQIFYAREIVGKHTYQSPPWYAIDLGKNDLLILTENTVNIHKLP